MWRMNAGLTPGGSSAEKKNGNDYMYVPHSLSLKTTTEADLTLACACSNVYIYIPNSGDDVLVCCHWSDKVVKLVS